MIPALSRSTAKVRYRAAGRKTLPIEKAVAKWCFAV